MDIDDIKKLVDLMVENNLCELDITDGESKISLRRPLGGPQPVVQVVPNTTGAAPAGATASAPVQTEEKLLEITSPMVGTFYSAPSPDSDPYVTVGANVSEDSVVCIIEAMKVMNEIKAECSGTIVQTLVKNAQPVEYGQVLFRVRPN